MAEWPRLDDRAARDFDLAIGPGGHVYALEDRPLGSGRVQVFDAAGTFLTRFGRGQILDSGRITVDSAGDAIVSDDHANTIDVFGPDGRLLRKFGERGSMPGQLAFPTALALSGTTLYVADCDHARIVAFDLPSGKPTGYWSTPPHPYGVEVDASGAVCVLTGDGKLTKYDLPR